MERRRGGEDSNYYINNEVNKTYRHALLYLKKDLNIIPLKYREKTPVIEWKEYQHKKVSKEEVEKWFRNKKANIAIICGRISGNLIVIDFDSEEKYLKWLTELSENLRKIVKWTWKVKTGRGYHVYFRLKNASLVPRTTRVDGVDLKADGGYVVAPPSIHPNGKEYTFIDSNPNIQEKYILKFYCLSLYLYCKFASGNLRATTLP